MILISQEQQVQVGEQEPLDQRVQLDEQALLGQLVQLVELVLLVRQEEQVLVGLLEDLGLVGLQAEQVSYLSHHVSD